MSREYATRRVYRGVVPGWDNTARTGTSAHLLVNDTPANYEQWLDAASHLTTAERAPGERLVFINAWNEWAEGCHLEPDRKHGRGYLEATRRVKTGRAAAGPTWDISARRRPATGAGRQTQQPTVGLSTRVAVGTASALKRYPNLYRVARSVYRSTLKR